MTIKKGDRVRLLRDNGWPKYGKKGEIGTVTQVHDVAVKVDGVGDGQRHWVVPLTYLELIDPPAITPAQAHAAGLLTAWMGEALGPCVPCDDEALVVRGRYAGFESMCGVDGSPPKSKCETRSAVYFAGSWELYESQTTEAFFIHATEAQALAWCARGVRP